MHEHVRPPLQVSQMYLQFAINICQKGHCVQAWLANCFCEIGPRACKDVTQAGFHFNIDSYLWYSFMRILPH